MGGVEHVGVLVALSPADGGAGPDLDGGTGSDHDGGTGSDLDGDGGGGVGIDPCGTINRGGAQNKHNALGFLFLHGFHFFFF